MATMAHVRDAPPVGHTVKENTMSTTHPPLFRTTMSSPIGLLTLVANDDAIVAIRWDTETDGSEPDAHNPVDTKLGDEFVDVSAGSGQHAVLDQAVAQLGEYFDGKRVDFELPLDPDGTEFQKQAWDALVKIPFGETISYGEQAVMLGRQEQVTRGRRRQRQEPDPDRRAVPPGRRQQRPPDRLRRRPERQSLAARP